MKKLLLFGLLALGPSLAPPLLAQPATSYNDVLMMINDSSKNSIEIANYFITRRHIPAGHVFHFTHDTATSDFGETTDSATFKKEIFWPLELFMRSNNLVDSINYIVSTKGCPLRVTAPHSDNGYFSAQSSFTDCIALANGRDTMLMLTNRGNTSGPGNSRYASSNAPPPFQHDQVSMPYYLTTRLDAYTVDQVKALIVRSETPAFLGQGLWVLDVDPDRDGNGGYQSGNDWLRNANVLLKDRGLTTLLDTAKLYVTHQKNVIGYASWGSNDGNAGATSTNAIPVNTYLNGAIAETYVSTGGRSFNPGTGYGQSLIADWIAEGVTGIKGYTDEPYLDVMADPDLLFSRFADGYNLAECYWSSSRWIAWRQVVIGDPKMTLRQPVVASTQSLNYGPHERYVTNSKTVTLKNLFPSAITFKPWVWVDGDSTQYVISSSKPIPTVVASQDSIVLTIAYAATQYALANADVKFPYRLNGSTKDNSTTIALSGSGVRPTLVFGDTVFADVRVGDTVTMQISVRTTAQLDTVTISSVASSKAQEFISATSYPLDIYPGESNATITVKFAPQDTGLRQSVLQIHSTATLSFKTLPLVVRGRGVNTSAVAAAPIAPVQSSLSEGFPNPFAENTTFTANVVGHGEGSLKIYDVVGRVVADLTSQLNADGQSSVRFDAANLPEGVYLCRFTSGATVVERTVMHLR